MDEDLKNEKNHMGVYFIRHLYPPNLFKDWNILK